MTRGKAEVPPKGDPGPREGWTILRDRDWRGGRQEKEQARGDEGGERLSLF